MNEDKCQVPMNKNQPEHQAAPHSVSLHVIKGKEEIREAQAKLHWIFYYAASKVGIFIPTFVDASSIFPESIDFALKPLPINSLI